METEQLGQLIGKTASLMEQFERRCQQIEQNQLHMTQRLAALAEHIPGVVRQSTDAHLHQISQSVTGSAREGLQGVVSGYEDSLRQSGAAVKNQAGNLNAEIKRLEKLHQHLVWKTAAILAISLASLIAGAIYLASHYRSVIEQNQISADLLKAYNRADVVLCGDSLCVNVDTRAKPYRSGEVIYHPVKARPKP